MEPEILFEDTQVTVAIKPPMMLSEQSESANSFAALLAKRNPSGYIGVVHRLDLGVGGVMVYARTASAASELSRAVAEHKVQKAYLAVVHGKPAQDEAQLTDLLFFDRSRGKSFVVDRQRKGVKEAILHYKTLETIEHPEYGTLSLLQINLKTGRTHQIRVQFSSRRHPLLGDGKYGASDHCPIALFSHRITFSHPKSKKELSFSKTPCGTPWDCFSALQGNP
ncbi:MAG: RNA pseudouridine synthase [Clostridia bacterium]|nr:RNA pseudouridine synthase [Clostridia bacterium]